MFFIAVQLQTQSDSLIATLLGEIDHHCSGLLRLEIDQQIELTQPQTLILDFSHVTFMDSSGIGLIMGRHRVMDAIGGELVIRNPPPHIRRVMRISGMERIAQIQNQKPEKEDLL